MWVYFAVPVVVAFLLGWALSELHDRGRWRPRR